MDYCLLIIVYCLLFIVCFIFDTFVLFIVYCLLFIVHFYRLFLIIDYGLFGV